MSHSPLKAPAKPGPGGEPNTSTICGKPDDPAVTGSGVMTGSVTLKGYPNEPLTTQVGIFLDDPV